MQIKATMRYYITSQLSEWLSIEFYKQGFPGGSVVKNLPPMQEAQAQSLIQEDPTCLGETKAMGSQLLRPGAWATEPTVTLLKPACPRACASQEKPLQWEAQAPQLESRSHSRHIEKKSAQQQRPSTAKNE